ncbi:MAG: hypothetical protein ACK4NF_00620 [Planctomycetota bacterium]
MSVYDNVIICLLINVLSTYFLWLFIKLKELDTGLVRFYLITGFLSVLLAFFQKKDINMMFLASIYLLFSIFHIFIYVSKIVLLFFLLLNVLLLYKPFSFFINRLDILQAISVIVLGINSALAFKNLIVGHWYLFTPTMSLKHFKILSLAFTLFSLARLVFLLTVYFFYSPSFSITALIQSYFDALFFGKIILLQLVPFLISLMARNALSYLSTQSATGFFYCITVFTISDFIVSLYLLKNNFFIF